MKKKSIFLKILDREGPL